MRANSSSARFPVLSLAAGAFSVMAEPQGGGTLSSDALGCRNHARACSFRERVPLSCDHGLIVGALPAVRFGPEEREDNRRSRRRFSRGDIHEMYPETAVAGCCVMAVRHPSRLQWTTVAAPTSTRRIRPCGSDRVFWLKRHTACGDLIPAT